MATAIKTFEKLVAEVNRATTAKAARLADLKGQLAKAHEFKERATAEVEAAAGGESIEAFQAARDKERAALDAIEFIKKKINTTEAEPVIDKEYIKKILDAYNTITAEHCQQLADILKQAEAIVNANDGARAIVNETIKAISKASSNITRPVFIMNVAREINHDRNAFEEYFK